MSASTLLSTPSVTSALSEAGTGPMPISPYAIFGHPPSTTEPGMQPARVWSTYSIMAVAGVSSWPETIVASGTGMAATSMFQPPGRMPPAFAPGGSCGKTMRSSWYSALPPRLRGSSALM